MEITVDPEVLEDAIGESVTDAVRTAINDGRRVGDAIAEAVTEQVTSGTIGEAIERALSDIDGSAMATTLAFEIQRTTTAAVVIILREAMTDTVARLRGVSEYTDEGKEARARIAKSIAGGMPFVEDVETG